MWIDEFLSLLSSSTITLDAIDRAHELKDQNLPNKIYKFRAVNDYSVSNFRDDTAWLCSADRFNDPYECATTWSIQQTLQLHAKLNIDSLLGREKLPDQLSTTQIDAVRMSENPMKELAQLLLQKDQQISPQRRDVMISELLEAAEEVSRPLVKQLNQHMQRGMKVCSFSSRVDSVVMWGHYANSHTGFAIEYDVASWPTGDSRRRMLYPVIYRNELFDVTKYLLKAAERKSFNNLFGTIATIHKSPDWSYENEWRFVAALGESLPDQNCPMPPPSSICIGSRMSMADKELLVELARSKGIPIQQMSLSPSEFKLIATALVDT